MKHVLNFILYLSAVIATAVTIIVVDLPLKTLLCVIFVIIAILAPIFRATGLPKVFDDLYEYGTGSELIASKVWDAWVK